MSDPVVILAGGKGTRLRELTGECPKPMLEVCGRPLLRHIMSNYERHGCDEFIIPVGYLGHKVFQYFRECGSVREQHDGYLRVKFGESTVTVVDTGQDTLTGGRLLRLEAYLNGPFFMTYGDGLIDMDPTLSRVVGIEKQKNVVTAVHPLPRFGSMTIAPDGDVVAFSEKGYDPSWINGGYFWLFPSVLGYIKDDSTNFERDVLPILSADTALWSIQHHGMWRCVDTLRDLEDVETLMKEGKL
jgi:glucose-1-phosphate cytidylyltransferase